MLCSSVGILKNILSNYVNLVYGSRIVLFVNSGYDEYLSDYVNSFINQTILWENK